LEKFQRLRTAGHASQNELERAETNYEVAEAKVRMAEEEHRINSLEVRKLETHIQKRSIRCPADGVVTEVHREAGEATLASDPTVLTIVQLDSLRARFPVSVSQAAHFHVGDEVVVAFPDRQKLASAEVQMIAPTTDAESGTVLVTLAIDNSKGLYRSGMRCILEVPDDTNSPDDEDALTPLSSFEP